jgi:phosphoenolpyruvate carboxykinase (ATP)
LNTGQARENTQKKDIGVKDTVELLVKLAREELEWVYDEEFGFEIPKHIQGSVFDPRTHYSREVFQKRMQELREQRKEWLTQFKELRPEIARAVY